MKKINGFDVGCEYWFCLSYMYVYSLEHFDIKRVFKRGIITFFIVDYGLCDQSSLIKTKENNTKTETKFHYFRNGN